MLQSTQVVASEVQVLSVLGKRAAEAMAWTIFLFLFGSCVAFMIITGAALLLHSHLCMSVIQRC